MFEIEIRNQTKTIIEAYQTVTGGMPILDINNFLLLRNQAEKELSCGIGAIGSAGDVTERTPAAQNSSVQKQTPPQPAAPQSVKKPVSVEPPKSAASKPPKAVKQESVVESEGIADDNIDPFSEAEEDPPSDFSILRSIKDPWN